jgi:hypothetical protein
MDVLETSTDGKYRLSMAADTNAENPRRDYEHVTWVITPKQRGPYRSVEIDPTGGPLQDGWDRVADRDDAVEVFTRWARIFHGAVVVEDRPDQGPWALWYMTPAQIAEIGNTPDEAIRIEIEEYRAWAAGDVWGYVIQEAVGWQRSDGGVGVLVTQEDVESCWGYIGREYAEGEARRAFEAYEKEVQA